MMALLSEHDSARPCGLTWVRSAEQVACMEGRDDLSGVENSTAALPSAT